MPRCISSTSPEDRSAVRYLARRPIPVTIVPSIRLAKSFGSGRRRSGRRASTLTMRAPSITGCSPRRTVSTSGSSGTQAFLFTFDGICHRRFTTGGNAMGELIAPRRPPGYGPREQRIAMPDTGETHFGFQTIDLDRKQAMVDDVFQRVARRYDLMNDLMSGGLHRAWKDAMVTMLNPPRQGRYAVADVAGGTGDVAFRIAKAGGPGTAITVCDTNPDMLEVGRARAHERGLDGIVTFVAGNAEALPFPDRSQDACTIAFGIRNVPRIEVALREFYRVLRPPGRFLCLEFSTVDVPGLA